MGTTMSKSGTNFLDALPPQNNFHVVMLGLDSAGKSTALYRLKFDQYLNTVPTIGFNCEKIQGTQGKAKGVQFLVWDVGGQEKLRPLWRSYTRCTDGILFVVDSVDVERMEEAKIELMRTAKCPDNQGVPVLILANKQDLPGARDPKELEKLLGLGELQYPPMPHIISSTSMSVRASANTTLGKVNGETKSACPVSHFVNVHSKNDSIAKEPLNEQTELQRNVDGCTDVDSAKFGNSSQASSTQPDVDRVTTHRKVDSMNLNPSKKALKKKDGHSANTQNTLPAIAKVTGLQFQQLYNEQYCRGWHIQPACAITGEGLQEGLEALYEMIARRRKHNRAIKKKR